jgi:hypothetical protein
MPAYGELKRQPTRGQLFWMSVLVLLLFLLASSRTLAGTLVNADTAISASNVTAISGSDNDSSVDGASVAIVPERMLRASRGDRTVTWTTARILKEVGKQAIDQPGHLLIGAAPIWASRHLVGVPWLGWVAAPILAYREWLQWPSNRWWDPPLDWAFFTLGAVAATCSRRSRRDPFGAREAIRRSVAQGLCLIGATRRQEA